MPKPYNFIAQARPSGMLSGNADKGLVYPEKHGAKKAAARSQENAADDRMHKAPTVPKRAPAAQSNQTSGLDKALSDHADKIHPVGGY